MREKNSKNSKYSNMSRGCRETMKSSTLTKKKRKEKPSAFYDSEPPCGPSNKHFDSIRPEFALVVVTEYYVGEPSTSILWQ